MARLRDPETGCPWDVEQTFETIAPYTIEEAYEVADAIERRDAVNLREELGDLLLQVVYHARLAEERGLFGFDDVVEGITTKMIRRHPHVFGDAEARSAGSAKGQWERIKAQDKAERAELRRVSPGLSDVPGGQAPASVPDGLLATVPASFPALTLALKVQAKAAGVGFDWAEPAPILAKIREETQEFVDAAEQGDRDAMEDELGDLLFSVVNLARVHEVDAEKALRRCVTKFRRRFGAIEADCASRGKSLEESSLDEMEAAWVAAKSAERR